MASSSSVVRVHPPLRRQLHLHRRDQRFGSARAQAQRGTRLVVHGHASSCSGVFRIAPGSCCCSDPGTPGKALDASQEGSPHRRRHCATQTTLNTRGPRRCLAALSASSSRTVKARDVATFRCRDARLPLRACDRDLAIGQIDVAPLERHDLATPQSRFTTQQHDRVRYRAVRLRSLHQFLEVREVVECRWSGVRIAAVMAGSVRAIGGPDQTRVISSTVHTEVASFQIEVDVSLFSCSVQRMREAARYYRLVNRNARSTRTPCADR